MDPSISNHPMSTPIPTLASEILTPKKVPISLLSTDHWVAIMQGIVKLIKPQLSHLSGFGSLEDFLKKMCLDSELKFFKPPVSADLLKTHVAIMFFSVQRISAGASRQDFWLHEARVLLINRDGELVVVDIQPSRGTRKCEIATLESLKALLNDFRLKPGRDFLQAMELLLNERKKRLEELMAIRADILAIKGRIDFNS